VRHLHVRFPPMSALQIKSRPLIVKSCPEVGQRTPSAGVLIVARGSREGKGDAVGDAEGKGATGVGCCGADFFVVIPLLHSNLLPLFIHVNFFSPIVFVIPALVHLVPAIDAALEGEGERVSAINTSKDINRRT